MHDQNGILNCRKAWSGGGGGGGYDRGGGGSGFVKAGGADVKMLPSANRDDGSIEIINEP